MSTPALPGSLAGWCGAAVFLWFLAAVVGVVRRRDDGPLPAILVGAGSALLLAGAILGPDGAFALPGPWYLGAAGLAFRGDPLARWFLAIIGIVGVAVALFSPGYLHHLRRRVSLGFIWAALAALMVSMCGVVLAANALVFLVAWEAMALSSFALVAADHEQHAVRHAALVYLGATRIGTAFLMAGFLWAHQLTGSWEFSAWQLSGGAAAGPAVLIFLGLATKAGCWPFHLWLPIAHPAAPAPVSALMSGVMIKTAIYAMARLLVLAPIPVGDGGPALDPTPVGEPTSVLFLGPVVLILGAISAFWGVLFALLQNDLKRLLAYSSVENIGLILMGLGLAMVARQLGHALLYQVGLAAGLLHTLNHALFKSLLFLGAGAIDARAHGRNLEHLGGLIHRMPWTGACFLAGSAAICALPPLNGFASEWLLYQGFLGLAQRGPSVGTSLVGLLLLGWLALVGGLALACFTKAAGVVFLGRPRTQQAERAREGTRGMVAAQLVLALACGAGGLATPMLLTALGRIAGAPPAAPERLETVWVLPLPALVLALGLTMALLATWMARLSQARPARRFITWECGFGDLGPRTQYTASSFAQPIARLFGAFYRYSARIDIEGRDRRHFPERISVEASYEPYLETRLYAPLIRLLQHAAGTFLMRLQAGSVHQYLLFMLLALGLLLWLGSR
jgi:hydrogenase-4 component B